MKKLLLIIIDAFSTRVLEPALENGQLPNMQALAGAGVFKPSCSTIFPSITHAATVSLMTGYYPREHGVPGSHWYNLETDEAVYYGDDIQVILSQGLDTFFENFVLGLNQQWLQAETLFQIVEKAGLKAACLNHIIFRGDQPHKVNVPQLLVLLPGIPFTEEIYGPSILCLGDFVTTTMAATNEPLGTTGGLLHQFGIEDDATADLLLQLVANQALPDFTVAYFPDNDAESHKIGPDKAVKTLEKIDTRLGDLFAACGGLDQMLGEVCLILTGDHSQSGILTAEAEASIKLDEILHDYVLAEVGEPWQEGDQLMICPNLRTAQIYFRSSALPSFEAIVAQLLAEPKIDQIIWRASITAEDEPGYHVATADRGKLQFWMGQGGLQTAVDRHGGVWSWRGDLAAVGGVVTGDDGLHFPDYPNAFERIMGGLDGQVAGHLWLTARPGHEFQVPRMTVHAGGGSHGSLHALDSTVPLFLAGLPDGVEIPKFPRTVDVAPLCLTVLGLESARLPGRSHTIQPER